MCAKDNDFADNLTNEKDTPKPIVTPLLLIVDIPSFSV